MVTGNRKGRDKLSGNIAAGAILVCIHHPWYNFKISVVLEKKTRKIKALKKI